MIKDIIAQILTFIANILLYMCLGSLVIWLAWNNGICDIINMSKITYLQATEIFWLATGVYYFPKAMYDSNQSIVKDNLKDDA